MGKCIKHNIHWFYDRKLHFAQNYIHIYNIVYGAKVYLILMFQKMLDKFEILYFIFNPFSSLGRKGL